MVFITITLRPVTDSSNVNRAKDRSSCTRLEILSYSLLTRSFRCGQVSGAGFQVFASTLTQKKTKTTQYVHTPAGRKVYDIFIYILANLGWYSTCTKITEGKGVKHMMISP